MAIVPDVRVDGGLASSVSSLAWNHTIAAALSNPILIGNAQQSSAAGPTVSTYQWDAAGTPVGLTRKGSIVDSALFGHAEIWFLRNPSSGTKQVKITWTAVTVGGGGSASYSGVDQATTFNAASPQTSTGAGPGTASLTVTSSVGELVIACIIDDENTTNDLLVVGGSQTPINNVRAGAGLMSGASSDKIGAASVTMTYTGLGASDSTYGFVGVSLLPAAGSSIGIQPANIFHPGPHPRQTLRVTSPQAYIKGSQPSLNTGFISSLIVPGQFYKGPRLQNTQAFVTGPVASPDIGINSILPPVGSFSRQFLLRQSQAYQTAIIISTSIIQRRTLGIMNKVGSRRAK